ncbi:DUF1080 domain-containing protein [Akkermansiaceae bacterium]|nr:DUF1080 domain-containing protein [Akkermansiaceae bacterium]MDB4287571.1 DUF1080 domain-containing protein [bacterium]MDA7518515.1 DUF1080 domain-containing protein [Akkermansiaceae bacterium]MDA7630064.1 DUF1080 domain-containing protein [Akkermansiaceae bacterium]MDA7649082.1 DUF1080 domain-containing protein [Akkermansiaceae bacterium]
MKSVLFSLLLALPSFSNEWTPIFDGESLKGWTNGAGKAVEEGGWTAKDGVLSLDGKGGSIYSEKEYGDFEFRFEWKISKAGNSGVKYRVTKYGKQLLGPEYQVLDDADHPDGKNGGIRQTASLYDLLPADPEAKSLKLVGEWNTSVIIAKGNHLQHFLNGKKVIDITVGSDQWKEVHAKSKFKKQADFATNPKGRLMLQDHSDPVSYRKLAIKELP